MWELIQLFSVALFLRRCFWPRECEENRFLLLPLIVRQVCLHDSWPRQFLPSQIGVPVLRLRFVVLIR